jgi:hypothetical protein
MVDVDSGQVMEFVSERIEALQSHELVCARELSRNEFEDFVSRDPFDQFALLSQTEDERLEARARARHYCPELSTSF